MHQNVASTHLDHRPEMTPAGMVYYRKCATDHAQRHAVNRSAGPYTGLFCPHLGANELEMRVESVLNINAPQFALQSPGRVESVLNINAPKCSLHSPGPQTRDDPSKHGVQSKVCNRSGPTPWSETVCWPIHRPILSTS